MEAFSIIKHIKWLARFCSSKSLSECSGSWIFCIALSFFLLLLATENKTFEKWASSKYLWHKSTGACTAQVACTQTIKPALSEIIQIYFIGPDSLQGVFSLCQVLSGTAVQATSWAHVQRLTKAACLLFSERIRWPHTAEPYWVGDVYFSETSGCVAAFQTYCKMLNYIWIDSRAKSLSFLEEGRTEKKKKIH